MITALRCLWETAVSNWRERQRERADTRSITETLYGQGPLQTRRRSRRLARMLAKGFSFSPDGRWSERQLPHVLSVLQPEADAMGLKLDVIEVTTSLDPHKWFFITVVCRIHEVPIEPNAACPECLRRI